MVLLILTIILLCFLYILFKRNFNYWTRQSQIPSLRHGKMFNGEFFEMLTFKTNFGFHLKTIYENEKFKNAAAVGVYGLYKPSLLIREPSIIKSILIKDFDCFTRHSCRADHNDPMGALSLFFSASYDHWRETRQKINSAFTSGKLKFMFPLLRKVGRKLENYLQQKGERFTLELKQVGGRYTTDVIATSLMGINSNALENDEEEVYKETIKLSLFNFKRAFDFLVVFFAPKLNGILRPKMFFASTERFVRSTMKCVMEERERTGGVRNDIIDVFLKIKRETVKNNLNVAECMDNLVAQACLLLLGGFETSASTMAYTLLELAKSPNIQKRLRQEIFDTLSQEGDEISYESLNKMEYLQMIIYEVLRLYPALTYLDRGYAKPSNRSSKFSLEPYYDFELPIGMPVYISLLGLHSDPKYWPNPTKFDPERFSPANKKLQNPMVYLPFGDGPLHCIGARLGMLEVKVGLLHLLKNYYVQICPETIRNLIFDPKSFLLQSKDGMYVEFVRDNMCANLKFTE